jgi:hypothetical protein
MIPDGFNAILKVSRDERGENLDCSVRALAALLVDAGTDARDAYDIAHAAMAAQGRKARRGAHRSLWLAAAAALGFTVTETETPHRTIRTFTSNAPGGRYLVRVRGHVFACINGRVYDDKPRGLNRITNIYRIGE